MPFEQTITFAIMAGVPVWDRIRYPSLGQPLSVMAPIVAPLMISLLWPLA